MLTKLQIVTQDGKPTRCYRLEYREYDEAAALGLAVFKMVPLRGFDMLKTVLRGVWCLAMHGSRHVWGDGTYLGVTEVTCLRCGMIHTKYPK